MRCAHQRRHLRSCTGTLGIELIFKFCGLGAKWQGSIWDGTQVVLGCQAGRQAHCTGPLLTFRSPPNSLPNLHCFNEGTKYAPLMWWVVRVWCRWGLTGGLSSRREGGGAATSKAQLTTEYTLRPPLRRLPCPHHCQCCFTFWPDFCSHSRHCHFQPIAHRD